MDQNRKQRSRIVVWLTSAAIAFTVYAPAAAYAAETYIQKPGH